MKYKTSFSFDEIDNAHASKSFNLRAYPEYEHKLDKDFYLKYFIKKSLFEVDIIDLKEFLEHHYDYCDDPEEYYKVLEYKVIPKVKEIMENGQVSMMGCSYYKETKLDNGFVETQGAIKNWEYDYPQMFHLTGLYNKRYDFEKKLDILIRFIDEYKDVSQPEYLKWLAGPSELGVLIEELITKGYLDCPRNNGEVNYSALSRELINVFNCKESVAINSLKLYVNPNHPKNKQTKRNFPFTLFQYERKKG